VVQWKDPNRRREVEYLLPGARGCFYFNTGEGKEGKRNGCDSVKQDLSSRSRSGGKGAHYIGKRGVIPLYDE